MDVTFNRQTIISFPDNDLLPDITPQSAQLGEGGIADSSLTIDEVLYPSRFTIGEYNANRLEVDIYSYSMVAKGEKIYVYQIVDEVEGGEPVEVPIFTGYVDSCSRNRGREIDGKHIIAYDVLYLRANDNIAEFWENTFDTVQSVTLKFFRESLMDYMELDYESVDLPNDYVPIRQNQKLDVISFEAMLKYVLEANGVNAFADRSGVVHFVTVSSDAPIVIDDTYAQNTSEFDTYDIPAFGGVRISNSTKGVTGIAGESNFVNINDNLLLMDKGKAALDVIANNILVNINTITYKPAKLDMIWNQLDIKCGSWVQIGDNVYLVCENYLSGSQLVDQQISSNGAESIEEAPSSYDAAKADMQAQISASSLKYYRYENERAIAINEVTKPIISIRYTTVELGVVIFHGCVIIDVERIDTTKLAQIELRYVIDNTPVREYVPVESYDFDGKHTLHLMHYWEAPSNKMSRFVVNLTAINCKVEIGAFRIESYMEGMGLIGDTIWDGIIDAEDNITAITLNNEPTVVPFTDIAELELQDVIVISAEDNVGELDLNTGVEPIAFTEILQINKEPISDYTWNEIDEYTWDQVEDMFYW